MGSTPPLRPTNSNAGGGPWPAVGRRRPHHDRQPHQPLPPVPPPPPDSLLPSAVDSSTPTPTPTPPTPSPPLPSKVHAAPLNPPRGRGALAVAAANAAAAPKGAGTAAGEGEGGGGAVCGSTPNCHRPRTGVVALVVGGEDQAAVAGLPPSHTAYELHERKLSFLLFRLFNTSQ